MVVVDGRIERIVDAGTLRFGPEVEVFRAEGLWILPGFIDVHAHLPERNRLEEFFGTLLDFGITGARCPATTTEYGVEIRDRLESGDLEGPTFRVAGGLIDGVGAWYDYAVVVTSEEEIRAEIAKQANAGVDFVKLYTQMPPDLVRVGILEAHARGVKVIGHLGRTTWLEAVDSGIDALTHSGFFGMASSVVDSSRRESFEGFYLPTEYGQFDPSLFSDWAEAVTDSDEAARELGRLLSDAGVVVDPNLVLLEAMIRGEDEELYRRLAPEELWDQFKPQEGSSWWYEEEKASALAALPHFFRIVRILHEEGATLAAGTDISVQWMFPGISFHRELELLSEAGISNGDVLVIATRNGAEAMGMLDETGTVESGKWADLVLLSADPIEDIRNTEEIAAVFRRGRQLR